MNGCKSISLAKNFRCILPHSEIVNKRGEARLTIRCTMCLRNKTLCPFELSFTKEICKPNSCYKLMKSVSFHNHPLSLEAVTDKRCKKSSSINSCSMSVSSFRDNDNTGDHENNLSDSASNSVSSTSKADSTFEHI